VALWWVAGIALLSTLVRALLAARLELFQDEALYWYLGVRNAMSFSPHPPGTALLARLGTALFGRTEFGVRAANVVLGGLVLPAFYLFARRLFSVRIALGASVAFALTPIYFGFGAICTPDMPQLFVCTLMLYATVRALEGDERWWLVTGCLMGVGLYFKYLLILYVPSLIVYLWWSGVWRRAVESRAFWGGVAIAVLLFFPVAAWREFSTGWGALEYHLRDRQRWSPAVLQNVLVYLGVHLAYYSPLVYAAMLAGLAEAARRAWRRREWRLVFLASFGGVPWVFLFLISSVTQRVLSREQWDAPAYLCGLVAAAWLANDLDARLTAMAATAGLSLRTKLERVRRGLVQLAGAALALAALTLVIVSLDALTALPSRLLGRAPLFRNMIGWRTLASRVDEVLAAQPADRTTVVLGRSFVPALQVAFYSRCTPDVYAFRYSTSSRYGLAQLMDRLGLSERALRQRQGVDAVFVAEGDTDEDAAREIDSLRRRLLELFDSVEPATPVVISNGKAEIARFYILLCHHFYGKAMVSVQ
jgi:hypothetical protein